MYKKETRKDDIKRRKRRRGSLKENGRRNMKKGMRSTRKRIEKERGSM